VSDIQHMKAARTNLHQIGLALWAYNEQHGQLPPPIVKSESGKPLYSWRVLLLPQLGEEELFSAFHLDEAWDSPHNGALLPRMPKVYESPGAATPEPHSTFYQFVVGPETVFGVFPRVEIPRSFDGAGTSRISIVAEAGESVPWSKPVDLYYKRGAGPSTPKLGRVFASDLVRDLFRTAGFHVLRADGSVRYYRLTEQWEVSNEFDLMSYIGEGVDW
jgi:hypothetical protein